MTEPARLPDIVASRATAGGRELDLAIKPDLIWFQGHFPDLPLLPGVVQLDWVLLLAEAHLGIATAGAASRFQVKYKAAIFPGDTVTLGLRHDPAKGRLSFEYRRGAEVCSSGSVMVPA
jgi:3-hydroxymyristoyl/3-hydroxydecanoyl-(acyl carrier protein) dehydratase